jgi:hypothetical protein
MAQPNVSTPFEWKPALDGPDRSDFMGSRLAPSCVREAVSPNGSFAPGSLVRSWRRIPGAGVEDFRPRRANEHALNCRCRRSCEDGQRTRATYVAHSTSTNNEGGGSASSPPSSTMCMHGRVAKEDMVNKLHIRPNDQHIEQLILLVICAPLGHRFKGVL